MPPKRPRCDDSSNEVVPTTAFNPSSSTTPPPAKRTRRASRSSVQDNVTATTTTTAAPISKMSNDTATPSSNAAATRMSKEQEQRNLVMHLVQGLEKHLRVFGKNHSIFSTFDSLGPDCPHYLVTRTIGMIETKITKRRDKQLNSIQQGHNDDDMVCIM